MTVSDKKLSGRIFTALAPGSTATPSRLQIALTPISRLYGAAAFLRRALYALNIVKPKHLPCPTISIGNITTGGTGKTPLTIYVATLLKEAGLSPLIISRGYRGTASKNGGIVSDGRTIRMDAGRSGDEPLLMAQRLPGVPVAVGRNRYKIGTDAIRQFAPDVILLDDGFQHFQLARNIDIVLLDHARPLGNDRLLPAGPLREPPGALRKADIIVFTRADNPAGPHPACLEACISDKPRFNACHVPVITEWLSADTASTPKGPLPGIDSLAGRQAYLFCGLADNQSFLDSVRQLTADIAGHRFFRDHHAYTAGDLAAISREAREKNADMIITSGKDYVKIRGHHIPDIPCDLVVLDAAISFKDQTERFKHLLLARIKGAPNA
jgi:tetraacyldisaccharide 4'-kinase